MVAPSALVVIAAAAKDSPMAKCGHLKKQIKTAGTRRARGKALAAYMKCKRGK